MRIITGLIIIIFLLSFTFQQQDIKKILCDRKWYMSYIKIPGKLVQVPDTISLDKRPWAIFYSDGRFSNMLNKKLVSGTWTYDNKTRQITTIENKKSDIKTMMELFRVLPDTLELYTPEKVIMGMQHFK